MQMSYTNCAQVHDTAVQRYSCVNLHRQKVSLRKHVSLQPIKKWKDANCGFRRLFILNKLEAGLWHYFWQIIYYNGVWYKEHNTYVQHKAICCTKPNQPSNLFTMFDQLGAIDVFELRLCSSIVIYTSVAQIYASCSFFISITLTYLKFEAVLFNYSMETLVFDWVHEWTVIQLSNSLLTPDYCL